MDESNNAMSRDDELDDVFTDEVDTDSADEPYELSDEELAELADEEDDPEEQDDEQEDEFSADEDEAEGEEGTAGEDEPSEDAEEQQPPNGGEDAAGEATNGQSGAENAQPEGKGEATPAPDYDKMAADDLAAIQRAFPGIGVTDLRAIDNAGRFGALREAGLSVEEAFRATNYERINAYVAARARDKADGKSHIRSDLPAKGTAAEGFSLSEAELRDARELFPDKSDKEIIALYRSVSTKK